MSDTEQTRVMGGGAAAMPGGGATVQMPAGGSTVMDGGTVMGADPFRTQMGGTATCPVCQTATPLIEKFCGECGFLIASMPSGPVEMPAEEAPAGELVDTATGRRYRLRSGENTVGRQGADILTGDGTVSRLHARVTVNGDTATIEDLGSSNGTKVGDKRYGANQPVTATHNTPLKFGNWRVTLELSGAAPAAAPADQTVVVSEADRTVMAPPDAGDDRTLVGASPAPDPATAPVPAADPRPADAVAVLRKTEGQAPDIYAVPGIVAIGRKAGNDVLLTGDAYISGRHAELASDNTGTYLTDVGSTNGTVVNGQRLAADERQLLLEGDEVQLGHSRFVFELLEPADDSPSDVVQSPHPGGPAAP